MSLHNRRTYLWFSISFSPSSLSLSLIYDVSIVNSSKENGKERKNSGYKTEVLKSETSFLKSKNQFHSYCLTVRKIEPIWNNTSLTSKAILIRCKQKHFTISYKIHTNRFHFEMLTFQKRCRTSNGLHRISIWPAFVCATKTLYFGYIDGIAFEFKTILFLFLRKHVASQSINFFSISNFACWLCFFSVQFSFT